MIDKHGATPLLLNGQSASYIGQEKYDEAEAALQEAVEKDPNNVDTLINLIVLAQQTGKSNEVILPKASLATVYIRNQRITWRIERQGAKKKSKFV